MWRNLLSALGSYASLAGLYYAVRPPGLPFSTIEEFLIVASIVLVVTHLAFETNAIIKSRPVLLKSEDDVKSYMSAQIKMGAGRTSILSRDLSWVDDDIEKILFELARHSNLTIFMESENAVSARLHSAGAEIFTYKTANFPITRFIITNEGRADARVALGARDRHGYLELHEYSVGDSVFHMCADIAELIRGRTRRA
jgi:hypothetical protein